MQNELLLSFFSAFFLGPYAFLGIGAIAERGDPIIWYYLAGLTGDVGGCLVMYAIGYFFKNKLNKILHFFKIKKETIDNAHHIVEKRSLFPIFLVVPLIPHSIDAAVYLVCGFLRISIVRFFLLALVANIILSLTMMTFGKSIQAAFFSLFKDHISFGDYIFMFCIILVTATLFYKRKSLRIEAE